MNEKIDNQSDTIFLRFVAILLIINSHLDPFYPIKYLGTGGALGNALFFALSMFGLTLSFENKPATFVQWYSKRIVRLFPSIWVTIILLILPVSLFNHIFKTNDILFFFGQFFYPPFWFLQALVIFYVIGYFLLQKYSNTKLLLTMAILLIAYIVCYLTFMDLSVYTIEKGNFGYFINIMTFIFGVLLARNNSKIIYKGERDLFFWTLSIFIIYGHKYIMTKGVLPELQFVQHLLVFPFIYYSLKLSRSVFIQQFVMQSILKKSIIYISGITLELYMAHSIFANVFSKMNLQFPVNILLLLLISFLFAAFIKFVADKFVRKAIVS